MTEAKSHRWVTGLIVEQRYWFGIQLFDHSSTHRELCLTLRQSIHLRVLIRRVRLKCQNRREAFVLTLKKDVNCLVTTLLGELLNRKLVPVEDSRLPEFIENKEDNGSQNSDPLGMVGCQLSY